MANEVRVTTKLTDDVSGPLSKIKANLVGAAKQASGGILAGIGVGGGIAAFSAIEGAARGATQFIAGAVDAASNLNETINKSQVVFGTSSRDIEQWGRTAATSMGLSENAAIGAASTIGNLLLSTGTAPAKIAPMSKSLVQLASDLASFNNISTDDALAKLESGLVGQERPLRELGVAISAASVDSEALALGFHKVNGEFTEGEKVQARYSLIFKQTTTAQGDFSRTSSALANSQRIVNAEWEDATAKLGQHLTPAVTELTHITAHDLIPALEFAVDKVADLAGGVGDLITNVQHLHTAVNGQDYFSPDNIVALIKAEQAHQAAIIATSIASGESAGRMEDDLSRVQTLMGDVHDSQDQLTDAVHRGMRVTHDAGLVTQEAWAQAQRAAANGVKQIIKIDYAGGRDAALALAQGLESGRSLIDQTWQSILDGEKHPLGKAAEFAHDAGILADKRLAEGLKSGDRVVREQSKAEVDAIVANLQQLATQAGPVGKKGMDALHDALRSKVPAIRQAAAAILAAIQDKLNSQKPWRQWGLTDAQAYAEGLSSASSLKGAEVAARKLMAAAMGGMGGSLGGGNGTGGKPTPAPKATPDVHVHIHSTIPPTPAQASSIAKTIVPIIGPELQRQGYIPR